MVYGHCRQPVTFADTSQMPTLARVQGTWKLSVIIEEFKIPNKRLFERGLWVGVEEGHKN